MQVIHILSCYYGTSQMISLTSSILNHKCQALCVGRVQPPVSMHWVTSPWWVSPVYYYILLVFHLFSYRLYFAGVLPDRLLWRGQGFNFQVSRCWHFRGSAASLPLSVENSPWNATRQSPPNKMCFSEWNLLYRSQLHCLTRIQATAQSRRLF